MLYQVGETIRLVANITDSDGVAADPATTLIAINVPDNSKVVDGIIMTNPSVGLYYYDYLIPDAVGIYNWRVVATGLAGRITIVRDSFQVEALL